MNVNKVKPNGLALLPIIVYLILFIGIGVVQKDFYSMPAVIGFLIALAVAFLQTRGISFNEKISIIAKGVGDDNIITMCLIFLVAGAFSGSVSAAGGVNSTVNLGLFSASTRNCSNRAFHHWMLHIHFYGNLHGYNSCSCSY